ncbi:MAG: cation:proton antiporter [Ardenticatenaceae bacterium]|nr:cation:proton antiporter [Ardenticatenaceae bacterium]
MTPSLQFMLALAIIIGAAKLGGLTSQRLHQPAVLGELLVGLILGPTILNIFHWPLFPDEHLSESVQHLAEVGVILLMFYAGLEIHLEDMLRSGRVALLAGVLGVIAPLVLGALVALPFGYVPVKALFIGIILTATSVSISAQTLMELGVLRRPPGLALLGAAVIDDVLVILLLSLFVAIVSGGGGIAGLGLVFLRMVVYLLGASLVGIWVLPRLTDWVNRMPITEGLVSLVVIVALIFAVTAEVVGGVAAITGAFIAGVIFGRTSLKREVEDRVRVVAYGFFVPIFFVSIGLLANARLLSPQVLPFVVLICLIAIISKIIGSGAGAFLGGFSPRQSLQVGAGMVSRGEVGLIVAAIGIENGLIGDEVFAIAVVVVLVTTLVTPLLLRWLFRGDETIEQAELRQVGA